MLKVFLVLVTFTPDAMAPMVMREQPSLKVCLKEAEKELVKIRLPGPNVYIAGCAIGIPKAAN